MRRKIKNATMKLFCLLVSLIQIATAKKVVLHIENCLEELVNNDNLLFQTSWETLSIIDRLNSFLSDSIPPYDRLVIRYCSSSSKLGVKGNLPFCWNSPFWRFQVFCRLVSVQKIRSAKCLGKTDTISMLGLPNRRGPLHICENLSEFRLHDHLGELNCELILRKHFSETPQFKFDKNLASISFVPHLDKERDTLVLNYQSQFFSTIKYADFLSENPLEQLYTQISRFHDLEFGRFLLAFESRNERYIYFQNRRASRNQTFCTEFFWNLMSSNLPSPSIYTCNIYQPLEESDLNQSEASDDSTLLKLFYSRYLNTTNYVRSTNSAPYNLVDSRQDWRFFSTAVRVYFRFLGSKHFQRRSLLIALILIVLLLTSQLRFNFSLRDSKNN